MNYRFCEHAVATTLTREPLLLATLPDLDWGLYACAGGTAAGSPVTEPLASLIESGRRYPPALALTREEIVEVFAGHRPTEAELTTACTAALRAYLARQPDAPFLLAESTVDEPGLRRRGEWYWLLQIGGTPPVVSWVTDGFRIVDAAADGFDLTGQQLRTLAGG